LPLALDRWLHELGLQDAGLSIRLVKADDLPPNSCGMSNFDAKGLIGEIDVLRSDEYVNLPGCLNGADSVKLDQLNTVIHEVMHVVIGLPASEEGKVVAISAVIQPRTHKRK
jgi:hypothetical protein